MKSIIQKTKSAAFSHLHNIKNQRRKKKLFDQFRLAGPTQKALSKKRILLIRPPFMSLGFGPPIGLAYLQNTLKSHGHRVLVWDINQEITGLSGSEDYNRDFVLPKTHPTTVQAYEKIDGFCDQILAVKPDIVGFSLSYPTVEYGLEMAKRLCKNVRCIAGGPQASFNEQNLLDTGYFDTIVSGYGEEAILDAISSTGIVTKDLDRSHEYAPDYTGITIDRYNGCLPIVTSRGCPNKCIFCTHNQPYFTYSVESVVKQIRNTPNIRDIIYNDSDINISSRRTTELFTELSKLKHKPPSRIIGVQIAKGFESYIPKMAEAGAIEARLGIESGSPRERKSMNKRHFTNDLTLEFIRELSAHKISSICQFIFCYPDQTEEDREETLGLMKRINDECDPALVKHFWYRFIVHHGTETLFREQYGVKSISPQNWENALYTPEKIERIAARYTDLIPANANIFC